MKARWLARWLYPRLKAWAQRTKPTMIISDGTGTNRPYLVRWKIVDSQWWHPGIYLHRMLLDDDSSMHDHPYASLSLVLTDGITEQYDLEPTGLWFLPSQRKQREFKAGDIVYRSSTMAHQLLIRPGGAWTLFIPFFRLAKGWGFYCPKGYLPNGTYHENRKVAIAAGKQGNLIGCGE